MPNTVRRSVGLYTYSFQLKTKYESPFCHHLLYVTVAKFPNSYTPTSVKWSEIVKMAQISLFCIFSKIILNRSAGGKEQIVNKHRRLTLRPFIIIIIVTAVTTRDLLITTLKFSHQRPEMLQSWELGAPVPESVARPGI